MKYQLANGMEYNFEDHNQQYLANTLLGMIAKGVSVNSLIKHLTSLEQETRKACPLAVEQLTDRQQTVLDYICRGFTAKEVAELLDISYFTVTTHLKEIYRKLDVNNRAEAIFEARQLGLIQTL